MNELTSDKEAMQANKANIGPGTGKGRAQICCLCGKPLLDYGHNPDTSRNRWHKPLGKERCCDRCNHEVVTPARMGLEPRALGTWEEQQAVIAQVMAQFKEGQP